MDVLQQRKDTLSRDSKSSETTVLPADRTYKEQTLPRPCQSLEQLLCSNFTWSKECLCQAENHMQDWIHTSPQ